MVAQKGILDLLLSIKAFIERLPLPQRENVAFRIGGEGVERPNYEGTATELGLDKYISWLGLLTRDQAKQEFQNCDCFILASHNETFGVVFAEAIACGKPIITTRCGGPEVIVTEENGILVDVSNVDQFADAMVEIYYNPTTYSPEIIRNQFFEKYSRYVVVSQLENVYSQVLSR
jgi:glycosyltransferase involved in cell wall biosynthesis